MNSGLVGTVEIICPVCGQPLAVPVELSHVGYSPFGVKIQFNPQYVEHERCPGPGSNTDPGLAVKGRSNDDRRT